MNPNTYLPMIGSIIGDIAGSIHEFTGNKDPNVDLFPPDAEYTDDSILTLATAEALLTGSGYGDMYLTFGQRYPYPCGGYGVRFAEWLRSEDPMPYNSWGNGSAMRVSPIGFALDTEADVLREAARSAAVTHDHPEGIKGAQATALAVFLARKGASKDELRSAITTRFGYDLSRTVEQVRAVYHFNESCQGTVPEALIAFLDAPDFETAIRNAISLGGDADTVACITGGVAQAFFKAVPDAFVEQALNKLPVELRGIVARCAERWPM